MEASAPPQKIEDIHKQCKSAKKECKLHPLVIHQVAAKLLHHNMIQLGVQSMMDSHVFKINLTHIVGKEVEPSVLHT